MFIELDLETKIYHGNVVINFDHVFEIFQKDESLNIGLIFSTKNEQQGFIFTFENKVLAGFAYEELIECLRFKDERKSGIGKIRYIMG